VTGFKEDAMQKDEGNGPASTGSGLDQEQSPTKLSGLQIWWFSAFWGMDARRRVVNMRGVCVL
jgi:hypothetical protein